MASLEEGILLMKPYMATTLGLATPPRGLVTEFV